MWKVTYDYFLMGEVTWFVVIWLMIAFIMLSRTLMAGIYYYKEWKEAPKRRRRVKKCTGNYKVTTLVTCAKEVPFAFRRAMQKLKNQRGLAKHTILVMIDAADDMTASDKACVKIAIEFADFVIIGNPRDKRVNLANLTKLAEEEGVLHKFLAPMDSDTVCNHNWVVAEMCDAFRDPRVGGVTSSQRCLWVNNAIERDGDWLEDSRRLSSMAAGSLVGEVLCLPGRLIMLLTSLVVPEIYDLPNEVWTGWKLSLSFPFVKRWKVKCKAGDDRQLTNYVLKKGKRTVMVGSAGIKTIVPNTFQVLWKTWRRWATSSQGYFYRTLSWLWRRPFAFYHALSDIFITHASVFLVLSWFYSIFARDEKTLFPMSIMMLLSVAGLMVTFIIRQLPHLFRHPADLLLLPHFIVVVTIGQFIRLWAHYTAWMIGTWGTRSGVDDEVGEVWIRRVK
ncbi:MAG: hypothetical protein RLZZ230_849 [Candidatus Parcubacteria bacterium]|jgi:cellulose synthase/poly-beta-1,6-N-acetylglucosamine synthase-like glycosyltransferase